MYWAASRFLPVLVRRPWLCGVLYGAVVYVVMNFVVVPLSAAPFPRRFTVALVAPAVLAHMILVGPPIALAVSRTSLRGQP